MKLSKRILAAFNLIGLAQGDQSNLIEAMKYEVTGCNNPTTNAPELSFRISQSFYELNVANTLDAASDMVLADGYYSKSVPENQLTISFPSEDVLALTYTFELTDSSSSLNENQEMVFNNGQITFECTYGRTISASSNAVVTSGTGETDVTGEGELTYDMEVDIGELDGVTSVSIIPNHSLNVNPQ